ncbi:MAG: DUF996 domain-containing protein [Chloroflexi bacterium]|nr:DUF996 domain-containing protein [Chloroflexota bacterium]
MSLESSKTLGGIGAILMFLGIFPVINTYGIIEIVGAVLILAGLHGLGRYYNDSGIFNNALYGVIVGIVGSIVVALTVVYTVLTSLTDFLKQVYPGWNGDWASLQNMTPNTTNIDPAAIAPFVVAILVVLVIIWVFAIIAAFFIRRSLKEVANKSSVGLFGTAGLLLLIGAIIPIIGLILIWIAALLLAIAFFTLKPQPPPMAAATAPPPPTAV